MEPKLSIKQIFRITIHSFEPTVVSLIIIMSSGLPQGKQNSCISNFKGTSCSRECNDDYHVGLARSIIVL